jgi:hypothetical protein
MKHKRATDYGGRTPLWFWIESAFIALIALAFIAALLAMVANAHAQPVSSTDIRVVDGDTIALSGLRQHVRLVGFNAPETRNAGCEGKPSWASVPSSGFSCFIACSYPPGTEATHRCNHGRRCGILRAEGRDVGSVLMSEGLALPFQCGKASCPPTPRPWCR